jgi:hypothetical protein
LYAILAQILLPIINPNPSSSEHQATSTQSMMLKATTLLLGAAAVAQGFVLPMQQRSGAAPSVVAAKRTGALHGLQPAALSPVSSSSSSSGSSSR